MTDGTGLRVALGALAGLGLGAVGVLVLPPLLVPGPDSLETQAAAVLPEPAATVSAPAPVSPEAVEPPPPLVPGFDTVRLEPDGSGLVAGRAEPGTVVQILDGEAVVAEAEADEAGRFVAFLALDPSESPRALALRDGEGRSSEATVILAPSVPPLAAEPSASAAAAAPAPVPLAEAGPALREGPAPPPASPDAGPALRPPTSASGPEADPGPALVAALPPAASPGSGSAPATDPAQPVIPLREQTAEIAERDSSRALADPQPGPTPLAAGQAPDIISEDAGSASAPVAGAADRVPPIGPAVADPAGTSVATGPDAAPAGAVEEPGSLSTGLAVAEEPGTAASEPREGRAEPVVAAAPSPGPGATAPATGAVPSRPGAAPSGGTAPEVSPAGPLAAAPDEAPRAGPAPVVAQAAPALPEPDASQAPGQAAVLLSEAGGVRVLQPALPPGADPEVLATVALDAIAYDGAGEVVLSGRADGGTVRLYLDNRPVGEAAIGDDGQWSAPLPDAEPGAVHTLRLDQVAADGEVLSRIETPFQREERAALDAAMADSRRPGQPVSLRVVQPGNTLWAIARDRYGEPLMYVRVFEANRDRIRNPDLIYPGQVFVLPSLDGPEPTP